MSSRLVGTPLWAWLMLVLALPLLPVGCGEKSGDENRLLLYCGAGLRPPVAEAVQAFNREHGAVVECDYAGSEVLISRIKLTGRGDLYMPGDVHYVELAEKEGLTTSIHTVCYFVPVILVRKGNPKGIRTLRDLVRPDVTLGLGDPKACAIGRKAARIFAKNNIGEDEIEPRVVFRSLTVNELGIHVDVGKIDAAIVWDAVAAQYADSTDVVPIPREENVISTVAIGVLSFSEQPELVQKFVEFVTSEQGKATFKKHHYATELPE